MTSKDQLRINLKKIRQTFVKQDNIQNKFNLNAAVIDKLFTPGLTVAGYLKTGSEVSAETIMTTASRLDVGLALPFIGARGDAMQFRAWQPHAPLVKAPYGFLQPSAEAPESAPDIILVPLVGFDRDMNRIGQGAGHYDRIFMLFPNALRIGLSWSCQECTTIPTDPWDVQLDAVLTEKEWIKNAHSRIAD